MFLRTHTGRDCDCGGEEVKMHLAYFDENKFADDNPYFWVGGLLIPDTKAIELENTLSQIQYNFFGTSILSKVTEFHGKELFHGKSQFKGHALADRVRVFHDIVKDSHTISKGMSF